ncbi:hypothetical protein ACGFRB_26040 [Streptomyces sp. NPDC048718]|uniref:hypothetical protein n=1 Tax=Streptomyces sp. NPDC048718 TaxID=3365587 RepID=UPI00371F23A6
MSQYDEYTSPSQAEGERLDEDMDAAQKRERHPMPTRTTPSQAEGERTANDGTDAAAGAKYPGGGTTGTR